MDTHDSYQANLPARVVRAATPAPVVDDRPASAEAGRPLNARMVFRSLGRYWWQILSIWLVTSTALVTAIYVGVKPKYEAVSLLRAEPVINLFDSGAKSGDMTTFLMTQVDLIKSTNVLSAALLEGADRADKIRKAEDPTLELRELLEVVVRPNTTLIQVSAKDREPKDATDIVNAVVRAYIKVNESWSEQQQTIVRLEKVIQDLDKQAEEASKRWMALAGELTTNQGPLPPLFADAEPEKSERGPGAAPEKPEHRIVQVEEYKEALATQRKNKADLIEAEIRLDYLTKISPDRPRTIEEQVQDALRTDQDLVRQEQERRKIVARVETVEMRSRQGKFDPAAKRLLADLERIDGQIKEDRRAKARLIRASIEANPSPQGRDPKGEARRDVAILRKKIEKQDEDLKTIRVRDQKESSIKVKIFMEQAALQDISLRKQSVTKRLENLRYEAKGVARISVADKAVPPKKPASNARPKLLLATPVVVLGALMSLFVMLELRSGRIGHPDEVSPRVRAEVFSVPPLPTLRSSRGKGRGDQVEEFTQRVDHLRVALCGEARDGVARCVLITSAAGGEGKTTLASQLAGRCANAGLSTLLIDADLRRPRLGQRLDVPEGAGLSDVLSGDAEVEAALVVIGNAGGFHLLPAGTPVADPSRILRGHRLGDLIGRLRRSFDIVILDTPPVLPVPDALTMGVWADGAVLAVRRDASRVSLVERASRMLSAAGLPILGVVVNGVKTSDMGYGGYSGYASYASAAVASADYATPTTPAVAPEV